MKRLLPSRTELAFFAALAIVAAGVIESLIAGGTLPRDLMMAGLALPVFVVAAVMGLRRSPQWAPADETDETREPAAVADASEESAT